MKEMENDIINPALMLAISRMKEDNNIRTQNKMVEEALNAKFLVPCIMQMKPGTEGEAMRNSGNTMVNFRILKNEEDAKYFMVFTDIDEFQKWQDNDKQNVMVLGFDNLASMVMNKNSDVEGFVINPATSNVIFRKNIIASIIVNRDKAIAEGKIVKMTAEEADKILRAKNEEGMGDVQG